MSKADTLDHKIKHKLPLWVEFFEHTRENGELFIYLFIYDRRLHSAVAAGREEGHLVDTKFTDWKNPPLWFHLVHGKARTYGCNTKARRIYVEASNEYVILWDSIRDLKAGEVRLVTRID